MYVCMYVWMYVCMYVCMCVRMHVRMYLVSDPTAEGFTYITKGCSDKNRYKFVPNTTQCALC